MAKQKQNADGATKRIIEYGTSCPRNVGASFVWYWGSHIVGSVLAMVILSCLFPMPPSAGGHDLVGGEGLAIIALVILVYALPPAFLFVASINEEVVPVYSRIIYCGLGAGFLTFNGILMVCRWFPNPLAALAMGVVYLYVPILCGKFQRGKGSKGDAKENI